MFNPPTRNNQWVNGGFLKGGTPKSSMSIGFSIVNHLVGWVPHDYGTPQVIYFRPKKVANPWCHGCRSLIIRHARQCGSCGCVWHPCCLMMLLESHSELFPKISQSQIGMDTWGWTHIDMEKPWSLQEMIFWQSNMAMEHSLSWMFFKVKSVFHCVTSFFQLVQDDLSIRNDQNHHPQVPMGWFLGNFPRWSLWISPPCRS